MQGTMFLAWKESNRIQVTSLGDIFLLAQDMWPGSCRWENGISNESPQPYPEGCALGVYDRLTVSATYPKVNPSTIPIWTHWPLQLFVLWMSKLCLTTPVGNPGFSPECPTQTWVDLDILDRLDPNSSFLQSKHPISSWGPTLQGLANCYSSWRQCGVLAREWTPVFIQPGFDSQCCRLLTIWL